MPRSSVPVQEALGRQVASREAAEWWFTICGVPIWSKEFAVRPSSFPAADVPCAAMATAHPPALSSWQVKSTLIILATVFVLQPELRMATVLMLTFIMAALNS